MGLSSVAANTENNGSREGPRIIGPAWQRTLNSYSERLGVTVANMR